jgi:hypothetical protein
MVNIQRAMLRKKYKREYNSWAAMHNRVLNKSHEWYHRYGGRGITICERWLKNFENFLQDMGPKPNSDCRLERKDNDGNYEPGNCKWATQFEQSMNRDRPLKYNKLRL